MVKIEHSTNSRARCQSCHSNIGQSSKLAELDCICTVIGNGDGWNQKLKCVSEKKEVTTADIPTMVTTTYGSTASAASATAKSTGKRKQAPSLDADSINAPRAKKKVTEVTPLKKSPIDFVNPYLKINSTTNATRVDDVTTAKKVPEVTPSKKLPTVIANPYLKFNSTTNATKVEDVATTKKVPEITPSKKLPTVINNPYLKTNSTNATKAGDVTDKRPPELSKKRPIVVNPYLKVLILTVTGIKYAQVCAYENQKVLLVREPENIHDKYAIKVLNSAGQKIGHIKRQQAVSLSPKLAKLDDNLMMTDCVLIDNGDGYNQKLRCVFKKKDTKVCDQSASSTPASTAIISSAAAITARKIPEVTPSKPIITNPYLNKERKT